MIPTTELRLGNFVNHVDASTGYLFKIIEIGEGSVDTEHEDGGRRINKEHLSPIALTEDWLLRFGLEKHEKYNSWLLKGVCVHLVKKEHGYNFDGFGYEYD
jgi:hypothetical protein